MGLQNLRPMEIIVIVLLIVLLFGAKKLPDLARGVGESLRIFKKEIRTSEESLESRSAADSRSPGEAEEVSQQVSPDLPK